jgi:hypothetical protein
LTEGRVIPIFLVTTGAKIPNVKRLEALLQGTLLEKPATLTGSIHLCLDAGYFGQDSHTIVEREGMIPPIRPRDKEKEEKREGKNPR